MKKSEFEDVIRNTPLYMPKFRIKKTAPWMNGLQYKVVKGDIFLYHFNGVLLPTKSPSTNLHPYPSQLEFMGYVKVKMELGRFVEVK